MSYKKSSTTVLQSIHQVCQSYLAAVSTGLAAPNTFSAETGLGAAFSGCFSSEPAPSAGFVGTSESRGTVRGRRFSFGRSRGLPSKEVDKNGDYNIPRPALGTTDRQRRCRWHNASTCSTELLDIRSRMQCFSKINCNGGTRVIFSDKEPREKIGRVLVTSVKLITCHLILYITHHKLNTSET